MKRRQEIDKRLHELETERQRLYGELYEIRKKCVHGESQVLREEKLFYDRSDLHKIERTVCVTCGAILREVWER